VPRLLVCSTTVNMASKIKVDNPVVEMDGDEMTRYARRSANRRASAIATHFQPPLTLLSLPTHIVSSGR
jgi:hypothetical protein